MPMISIAISYDVDPVVMVSLSKIYGDIGLLLINDEETLETYMNNVSDKLPIGSSIEELKIIIENKKDNA